MLASANAVGDYTDTHILPLLSRLPGGQFHQEEVPFFAARTVFGTVTGKASLYTFRYPTLNPTNPADRPDLFDVEVIRRFRDDKMLSELTGVRTAGRAKLFFLARPVRIDNQDCLICHSTPERAPPAMLAQVGTAGGFGWTMGETVGIQMLTVPLTEQLNGVLRLLAILTGGLLLVFAVAYFALSASLDTMVVRPLDALARAADTASRSAEANLRLPRRGVREVHRLVDAIERLRVSLIKALAALSRSDSNGSGTT